MADTPTSSPTQTATSDVPFAVVRNSPRRTSVFGSAWFIWLIPAIAAITVIALLALALSQRGPLITIGFLNGQGLKVTDPVMYRGVRVGEITAVRIAANLEGLEVDARLQRDAASLAREGSRFWIVRPEVSLSRVSGLETLLGPRYIEVLPPPHGSGTQTVGIVTSFRGMEGPPDQLAAPSGRSAASPRQGEGADDLTLILEAQRLGSTQPGSPVLYRGFKVGQVMEASLSQTGQRVELRAVIYGQYAHLVRKNSRWWITSGIGIDFGIVGGLSVRTGSLESVISGGVSFATPDRPTGRAVNGDRFTLEPEASKDWADWSPNLNDGRGSGGVLGRPGESESSEPSKSGG